SRPLCYERALPFADEPGLRPPPLGDARSFPYLSKPELLREDWRVLADRRSLQVANGPLSGRSLAELSEKFGPELVGEAARDPKRFPLLLKFLFPHEKLSVQVHPDDE